MRTPLTLAVLCCSVLLLSACDNERPNPLIEPVKVEPVTAPQTSTPQTSTPNTTVPAADSVLGPTSETPKTDAAAGRTNSSMTRAQESSAMPMAGQTNDHSAPLAAAKGASRP